MILTGYGLFRAIRRGAGVDVDLITGRSTLTATRKRAVRCRRNPARVTRPRRATRHRLNAGWSASATTLHSLERRQQIATGLIPTLRRDQLLLLDVALHLGAV